MFNPVSRHSRSHAKFRETIDEKDSLRASNTWTNASFSSLPHRSLQSGNGIAVAQIQYARPAVICSPRNTGQDGGPAKDQLHASNSEHMLRRKTPNGTIAAGYDGTPISWYSKPSATKHVVLSAFIPTQHTVVEPNSSVTYASYPANISQWPFQRPGLVNQDMLDTKTQGNSTEVWYTPASLPLEAIDVFGQIPMQIVPTMISNNGVRIPTVLQPAYQSRSGPTASNEAGFYGPYWPGGRFVPYRPAAFRDEGLANLQLRENNTAIGTRTVERAEDFQDNAFSYADKDRSKQLARINELNSALTSGSPYPWFHQQALNVEATHLQTLTAPSASNQFVATTNAQFKEKALSRAHRAYINLLDSFQRAKRDIQTRSNSAHSNSRHNIFPRPPQPPAVDRFQFKEHANLYSLDQTSYPRRREDSHVENLSNSKQRFTHSSAPHVHNSIADHQASVANATSSLEMLSSLCEESGWTWVDGMLLGGCLAYWLEDYNKALEWCSRIIAIDPSHVEAISNLAAALLSLNRREEAERYWLRSVKLRPNYFEAVEHLIGLLCSDHRNEEAIGIIEFVERSLRIHVPDELQEQNSDTLSDTDHSSVDSTSSRFDQISFDYKSTNRINSPAVGSGRRDSRSDGFGSSGYAIPGSENGRMLALVHAKGNMLYALGNVGGASRTFEDAVLISTGKRSHGIRGLIRKVLHLVCRADISPQRSGVDVLPNPAEGSQLLLPPDKALQTSKLVFPTEGELPGLHYVPEGLARNAAVSTTSNSLLSLAKMYQDEMSNLSQPRRTPRKTWSIADTLALYYLSLSLQPAPSTANNIGILLASVQQSSTLRHVNMKENSTLPHIPGVVPGSGVALALAYYNYGLNLDPRHAHLYTNLGSLLKDIGQLTAAVKMYEQAVQCDPGFDIALANLANAVKDQGRISQAIEYYKRAVKASPDFAEAVCGLANALNSVCDWTDRGGVILSGGKFDRWHVDGEGMLLDARAGNEERGWMKKVVEIVGKQLADGLHWGRGVLQVQDDRFWLPLRQLDNLESSKRASTRISTDFVSRLRSWVQDGWEGARVVRLIERATKRTQHRWYHDKYVKGRNLPGTHYPRIPLPTMLSIPDAPTVLPFHTFTCPLTAKDVRMISQRNALRVSCSTLKAPWLPLHVYHPPPPPNPVINVGYVSSDFNNHPLSHLMQSVFGFHDRSRVKAFCYATTASDNSAHRRQIENEAPKFHDASAWPAERLIQQILTDEIHILVNLNGYTRGARNEVFAARPAPVQMSFMGFAGTLGAEWCDYLVADTTAIPSETLRPYRQNVLLNDVMFDSPVGDWVYSENVVFTNDTFFCCDHAQSAAESRLSWADEQARRWAMRKELFPSLSDEAVILGNFNQLYKIDPTTFRSWLRILSKVPKAILWLLRFPNLGESNLRRTAAKWAGDDVASRIWFTDVAPKSQHISRARVCDLFLDTPECNAHTTAADVLWSSTPILTLPRYKYKMCSRMAASILKGALPKTAEGDRAAAELIAKDDHEYEDFAVQLASGFSYRYAETGVWEGQGRLAELRRILYENRWTSGLFDTKRWVAAVEQSYEKTWQKWVMDEGGDIYL